MYSEECRSLSKKLYQSIYSEIFVLYLVYTQRIKKFFLVFINFFDLTIILSGALFKKSSIKKNYIKNSCGPKRIIKNNYVFLINNKYTSWQLFDMF